MTEYELISAISEVSTGLRASNEFGLAVLTGYLLIAHYVGRSLSFGQVAFVNVMFVAVQLSLHLGAQEDAEILAYLEQQAVQLNPNLPFNKDVSTAFGGIFTHLAVLLITSACLAFMWRVRHPKAEQPK